MLTEEQVREALKPVQDPELHLGILDLGLVYGIQIEPQDGNQLKVNIQMTLTSPACPYGPMLMAQVDHAVRNLPGVGDCSLNLVFDPPWDPHTMTTEECRDILGLV